MNVKNNVHHSSLLLPSPNAFSVLFRELYIFKTNTNIAIVTICSRSLKMWDVDRRTCLISLGGHLHRVSSVSICPVAGQTFVTSSLDCSLKVWNMAAVASGRVPPRGGLHYTIVEVNTFKTGGIVRYYVVQIFLSVQKFILYAVEYD